MNVTKQADLARLFGRSTSWVCKCQKRSVDPMPVDLQGATDWGRRNGYIKPDGTTGNLFTQVQAPQPGPLEMQELELKRVRTEKLLQDLGREGGQLMPRQEVEERELQAAAEFRMAACAYPSRARAVIERFVPDPAVVESIMAGLQPLAADLLNRADPHQALKGKPVDEVRRVLLARVEALISCL